MPKVTRRSAAEPARSDAANGGDQGSGRITVHAHDVLNGRGVNMAHHPGNMRFRTLIQTRADPGYCSNYTLAEKKALADEIVQHIEDLDPPGRFLKRPGKTKNKRGLSGPWELMTREEAVKKARQALRDCNRPDREGYAKAAKAPSDVVESAKQRKSTGLTQQQYIKQLVATNHPDASNSTPSSGRNTPNASTARCTSDSSSQHAKTPAPAPAAAPAPPTRVPLVVESKRAPANISDLTTSWIPEKTVSTAGYGLDPNDSLDAQTTPLLRNSTPTTAATSVGFFPGDAEDFTEASFHNHEHQLHHEDHHPHHPHGLVDVAGAPSLDSPTHHFAHSLAAAAPPVAAGFMDPFEVSLTDDDTKPRAVSSFRAPDPLQEEADAAVLTSAFGDDEDFAAAFATEKHLF